MMNRIRRIKDRVNNEDEDECEDEEDKEDNQVYCIMTHTFMYSLL